MVPGAFFCVVGGNIQAFARQRDSRIGGESHLIKGFAGTAVEMEGCDPAAFNVEELVRHHKLQERKTLTTDVILEDLDFQGLAAASAFHFLDVLIQFVHGLADEIQWQWENF
ncbi:hypothetical protein SERLADRAFT_411062 [Serpula lacrymans var. lacrymans S7.9]|uniref:Uncharacterized protein n=1 Tax=Serpula lacrymans var. lacrymans (strain S7.9) TaxID=578457 RepID=F8P8U6_SERL9|nr:uncharacterized protein SERLADRAFT_411062 [Serpula lacrymans var. lacrymans S7.9]EGO20852.1 hypothetical protein SERLADRAFT_411062 [Serpula lacrymans var. lacrymans S7.9]